MIDYFYSLEHTWTRDIREPLFTFELHDETWGFYLMSLMGWNLLLAFCFLHAFVAAASGVIVYKFIIQQQGSLLSYLTCAVMVPLQFLIPFYAFGVFSIRNQLFRFCMSVVMPVTCMFKTTAATYGFTPDYAKTSAKRFALYYATPMLMTYDQKLGKFEPFTKEMIFSYLKGFANSHLMISLIISLTHLWPSVFPPMAQGWNQTEWYKDFFTPKILFRNAIFGFLLSHTIQCLAAGLTVAQVLATRNKAGATMDNPITTSRNMREMWSQKWNVVIHDALKLGVYLPARKYFPKMFSMFLTFLASGLFHEIALVMFTLPFDDSAGCFSDPTARANKVDCYVPKLGWTTLYFLWHAALVGLELSPLGQMKFWSQTPRVVCILYILYAGALPADFFGEPYWNSLAYENGSVLFFVVKPVAHAVA